MKANHRTSAAAATVLVCWIAIPGALAQKEDPEASKPPGEEPPYAHYLHDREGYQWRLNSKSPGGNTSMLYDGTLTSQNWHGATWTHPVQVIVPKSNIASDLALVFVHWSVPLGSVSTIPQIADDTGIVCVGTGGMYQACFGASAGEGMVAYGTQQYLKTGDPTWAPTAAAVKSLIRTMDAVEELSAKEMRTPIRRFILVGHSKMGLACWATAVSDARVKGIIPIGADVLNMPAQPKTAGLLEKAVGSLQSDAGKRLLALLDPFTFRQKLTAAKLIISGADDEMFDLDAVNRYWDELPGPKWHLYLDNADHTKEVGNPKSLQAIRAFATALARNQELPQIQWKFVEEGGKLKVQATSSVPAKNARLWSATGPFGINSKWSEQPMKAESGGRTFSAEAGRAPAGVAAYAELEFEKDGQAYPLTTAVHILP